MAYDIGPRIGIDGETEFRKSIQNINANIKALNSEMKLVTATYEDNADSMEALSAKSEVLEKTFAQQEKHLEEVSKMLEKAADKYGESSTEAQKWQRAVNESKTALQKTSNELSDIRSQMEKLDDSTEDAADAMEDLGEKSEKASGKLDTMKVAAGNLLSQGVSTLLGGIKDAAMEIINLDEATEDYRINQGKLEAAYTATGKSAEMASTVYRELYKILGDTDQATEAAQLMADLAENEEDVGKWADIAAGTVAKFGDSLPVENLIETAQEAVKTGEAVSGGLADALMWSGVNVDDFNAKLAACTTEQERNQLITETLTDLLGPYADAFYKANEEVVKGREAQANLDEATGKLGESIDRVKNSLLEQFGPAIEKAAGWAAGFIDGVDTEKLSGKFHDAWESIRKDWEDCIPLFEGIRDIVLQVGDAIMQSSANSQAMQTQQYALELQEQARAERNGTANTNTVTVGLTAEDIANAVESGVKGGFSGAALVFDTGKTAGQITTAQKNNDKARGGSSGSW